MRSQRRRGPNPAEAAEPAAPAWTSTFGNLFMVLLAFFIMLYASPAPAGTGGPDPRSAGEASAQGSGRAQLKEASLSTIRRRVESSLNGAGATGLVRIEESGQALILHLDASAAYESGRAEIRKEAIPALDAIGSVLATVGNAVRVEGHTDSTPMIPSPQFPDNWALSAARAGGVLRYLREWHQIGSDRLSMAGYADTRPVADNATPEGRARNRRVDIVVFGR
jgi:chemotaxis protein MotB